MVVFGNHVFFIDIPLYNIHVFIRLFKLKSHISALPETVTFPVCFYCFVRGLWTGCFRSPLSFLPVARVSAQRYCALWLFYGSVACRRGNTVSPSPLRPCKSSGYLMTPQPFPIILTVPIIPIIPTTCVNRLNLRATDAIKKRRPFPAAVFV